MATTSAQNSHFVRLKSQKELQLNVLEAANPKQNSDFVLNSDKTLWLPLAHKIHILYA
ncbi:hypothetical protein IPO96_03315 [Candidatus Saccharibacteria bacterium]|nr:MAG: hypothetical protein IPO96_03315 [Candidatus Saccharibacteria bacterium]